MDFLLTFEELTGLLADFTQIGFMEAVKAYEPAQDNIRRSEVKKWLKMMLVDYSKFNALVNGGYIKPRRMGTGKNSPLCYSKKEIIEAIKTARLSSILTNKYLAQNSELYENTNTKRGKRETKRKA